MENIYKMTSKPSALKVSKDWHNEIIKLMYAKINMDEHVKTLTHLSSEEQTKLVEALKPHQSRDNRNTKYVTGAF